NGHAKHVGDRFSEVFDGQNLHAIPCASALAALHKDISHELHVDLNLTLSLASRAAPSFDVEAEMARRVVVRAGLDRLCKYLSNRVKRLEVGDGIRACRTPDRALIDEHHVVDQPAADHVVMS